MTTENDMRLEIMTRIVEYTELQGQARLDTRLILERMQQQQDIVPIILDLLKSDELGYSNRTAAAELLADWREERVLPILQELIDSGIEPLQEVALSAFYRFSEPVGIDILIKLLNNNDRNLVERACDYLGTSRLKKVVIPLIRILNHHDPRLRYRAILALGHHGSSEAYTALETRFEHEEDPELKAKIYKVLNQINIEEDTS